MNIEERIRKIYDSVISKDYKKGYKDGFLDCNKINIHKAKQTMNLAKEIFKKVIQRKIHYESDDNSLCGLHTEFENAKMTSNWNEVSCKSCLKYKNNRRVK